MKISLDEFDFILKSELTSKSKGFLEVKYQDTLTARVTLRSLYEAVHNSFGIFSEVKGIVLFGSTVFPKTEERECKRWFGLSTYNKVVTLPPNDIDICVILSNAFEQKEVRHDGVEVFRNGDGYSSWWDYKDRAGVFHIFGTTMSNLLERAAQGASDALSVVNRGTWIVGRPPVDVCDKHEVEWSDGKCKVRCF